MNEKIRELAEQVGLNFGTNISGIELVYGTFEGSVISHIDSKELTKFAELIVRECVESLWTEECYTSDLALKEFLKNSKKINLHFGVE